jgi:hypothetical protein
MPIDFSHVSFVYSPRSPFQYEALKDVTSISMKEVSSRLSAGREAENPRLFRISMPY